MIQQLQLFLYLHTSSSQLLPDTCEHNVYTTRIFLWFWDFCSGSNRCAPANLWLECTRSNVRISIVQVSIHILKEDLSDHIRWGGLPSLYPWQGRVCCHGLLDAHWSCRQKICWESSITTWKVPWMMRYLPMLESMSRKMSGRGQMRQLMHSLIIYTNLHTMH